MKLVNRSLVMCSSPVSVFWLPMRMLPIHGSLVMPSQTSVGAGSGPSAESEVLTCDVKRNCSCTNSHSFKNS